MNNFVYLVNPKVDREKAYRADTNLIFEINNNTMTLFAPKYDTKEEFLRSWLSTFEFVKYLVKTKKSILINEIGNIIKWNKFKTLMYDLKNKVMNNKLKYFIL